jgi:hypothetical protein
MNIGKSINVGSRATTSAMKKATNVAMGANRQSSISAPLPMPRPMRRRIHPGSAAGLRAEKSVYLNMEGAGYLNPANQIARYTKRVHTNPKIDVITSVGFSPRNRTLDTRALGSGCGTVKMLRERL